MSDVDIGDRYGYLAAVMYEQIDSRLKKRTKEEIPKGVFSSACRFFDLGLSYFNKNNLNNSNPLEAMCLIQLIMDVMPSKQENLQKLENKLNEMFKLTKNLENLDLIPKNLRDEYKELSQFFFNLTNISNSNHTSKVFSGLQSKYRYPR